MIFFTNIIHDPSAYEEKSNHHAAFIQRDFFKILMIVSLTLQILGTVKYGIIV